MADLPAELIAVRHGESIANAAFARADRDGMLTAGVDGRDADVALSERGRVQVGRLGRALAAQRIDAIWCSPFRRAVETTSILALREVPVRLDERLRDRDQGILELLTARAMRTSYPAEIERRARLGEFYYRPPGGESLADVAERMRSVLRELAAVHPGERVLIVAHDAVVLMLRYVIEELTEAGLNEIIGTSPVRNAGITRWVGEGGRLRLSIYNDTRHLASEDPPGAIVA